MKKFVRRPYEVTALVAVRQERLMIWFWARRCRKSTNLGSLAFDEMSKEPGRTVISASASLLLGSELINMTLSATEQAMIVANEAAAVKAVFENNATEQNLDFQCADSVSGKVFRGITPEEFTELYQSKRLEMRLYHDRTAYSRQLVIAPNPATARSWRGTVLRDEAGFTPPNLERDLQKAVDPMMRDVPDLKMIYASNLCGNDHHPFFEMTLPSDPELELPVNPSGNFYRGHGGILVHRVSLKDAYAAGHVLYDNKGKPMTYEQFAGSSTNKGEMDESYDLNHKRGGSSVIDFLAMLSAQTRGARECAFVFIHTEAEFSQALDLLLDLLGPGAVGIGFDVATTTKQKSNPSSITVTELSGIERKQRIVICWKEKAEAIMKDRVKRVVRTVAARREGGKARRLCIDASSERLFAQGLAAELRPEIPVQLVVSGESIHPAGYEEPTNYKTFLGDTYAAAVNGNRYCMASAQYLRDDHGLVTKNAGRFECEVASNGAHGDTFDSGKLAEYALMFDGATFGAVVI